LKSAEALNKIEAAIRMDEDVSGSGYVRITALKARLLHRLLVRILRILMQLNLRHDVVWVLWQRTEVYVPVVGTARSTFHWKMGSQRVLLGNCSKAKGAKVAVSALTGVRDARHGGI
jgi:hypothetical protein